MGRGRALSQRECDEIKIYSNEGYNPTQISKRINRSVKAVRRFLKRLQAGIKTVRRGAPRKLSPKLARAIVRRARSGLYSAKQLQQHYNAGVSVPRVQQVLAAAPEQNEKNGACTAAHEKSERQPGGLRTVSSPPQPSILGQSRLVRRKEV